MVRPICGRAQCCSGSPAGLLDRLRECGFIGRAYPRGSSPVLVASLIQFSNQSEFSQSFMRGQSSSHVFFRDMVSSSSLGRASLGKMPNTAGIMSDHPNRSSGWERIDFT